METDSTDLQLRRRIGRDAASADLVVADFAELAAPLA
jgi:hypothetical protein